MSAMSGSHHEAPPDTPPDAMELDTALQDSITHDAEVTRPIKAYHSRKKQKQFFGDNPFLESDDKTDSTDIPRSSMGVLNDKETMAVPGMCYPRNPFALICCLDRCTTGC